MLPCSSHDNLAQLSNIEYIYFTVSNNEDTEISDPYTFLQENYCKIC